MLRHFKVNVCSTVNTKRICADIFGDREYLCVLHKGKGSKNPHWHFQGETDLTQDQIGAYLKKACSAHAAYISNHKGRPFRQDKKEVTHVGYQYMLKEDPPVVVHASEEFDEDRIADLHEMSMEYVQEIKDNLYNHLQEKQDECPRTDAEGKHKYYKLVAGNYYLNSDKMPPPNFQKLVLFCLARIYRDDEAVKVYVFDRI